MSGVNYKILRDRPALTYPRHVTSIHQIEISSRCNLRCVYCPSKDLDKPLELPMAKGGGFGREKVDITTQNFAKALEHAAHYQRTGTQGELALTGIGEALLHPHFVDLLAAAREALPDNLITFSTNGLLLDDAMCERIKPYRPRVYVSLHRPEKAKPAIDAARRHGLYAASNTSFADEAFDWAGAVDWEVSIDPGPDTKVLCAYLADGKCVVLADGRVTACCLDAEGAGVNGHVDDPLGSLHIKPWEGERQGCEGCHMLVP